MNQLAYHGQALFQFYKPDVFGNSRDSWLGHFGQTLDKPSPYFATIRERGDEHYAMHERSLP